MKYEKIFSTMATFYIIQAVSDENVTVIDREFNNIPVRLYLPKRKLERKRPAVIFIHGGIFVFGSCSKYISDMCVVHIFIFKKVLYIDRILSTQC